MQSDPISVHADVIVYRGCDCDVQLCSLNTSEENQKGWRLDSFSELFAVQRISVDSFYLPFWLQP